MTTESGHKRPRVQWHVRGVSLQGYHHLSQGVECQDAYRSLFIPSADAWVLAVSDGAGSRRRAAEGSALAAGLAVSAFQALLAGGEAPADPSGWREMLTEGYTSVLTQLHNAVSQLSDEAGEFAATLSIAVLAVPWIGLVNLGDGFVILQAGRRPGLHLISLSERESEYSNETVFVTSSDAPARAAITCVYDHEVTAVVLSTDGLAPVATAPDPHGWKRPNASFIDPLLEGVGNPNFDPTDILKFLLHERIGSTSGDDKTMVIAVAT